MEQQRFNFDLFSEYENAGLQKVLHLLRLTIDLNYYYKGKSHEDCLKLINGIISSLNLKEIDKVELQRKVLYHLNKHILLGSSYNIKHVYEKEWNYEERK